MIICYTIILALILIGGVMYIEVIEKYFKKINKAYKKLIKNVFYEKPIPTSKPIRKKRAPEKRKPNKKDN